MDNFFIAEQLRYLAILMEIHGENPFKAKAYAQAAFQIEKLPVNVNELTEEQIFSIKGVGNSVAKKISELLKTGKISELESYLNNTPPGVIELLQIKGIGPRKIHVIWKEMGIESIGELQYACHENRLIRYKGFGEKTQQNILEAISFYLQQQGKFLYAQAEEFSREMEEQLKKHFGQENVRITGDIRRQLPVVEEIAFVITRPVSEVSAYITKFFQGEIKENEGGTMLVSLPSGIKVRLYAGKAPRALRLFETTGPSEFIKTFKEKFPEIHCEGNESEDDEILFTKAGMPYIRPYYRDYPQIWEVATEMNNPQSVLPDNVLQPEEIRGVIHCHSDWSDGVHTIEQLAEACIQKGYEYLVISDHSQSAAYANGLTPERITSQHRLIDALNQSLAPFKIFKSIECDILAEGDLDYSDEILMTFDLVIVSVHSQLKMTSDKAMKRLLKAIAHPCTRILGHPTGRLLLSRKGYPVDHEELIDACATYDVSIEINAHPRRLDLDWQWIPYAMQKNVLLSVNPDAHSIEGIEDIRYGVLAAQKGGLKASCNLSSFTLTEFEKWVQRK